MAFDPAGSMPKINWVQQGSFEEGSIPPVVEPDAGTQVWLGPIAREWLPWVCGALDQLRNPSSWIVADDAHMYDTLRRVDTLQGLICTSGGNLAPLLTRLQGCVLQTSGDGGVTWVDVPGWVAGFPDCVRSNLPPPPPNLGPTPTEQRACNIAGYLASEIMKKAMALAVSDYNAGLTALQYASNLSQTLLSEAFPYANLFVQATYDFYSLFTAGTIAAFTSASTDPTLWSELTCAIYTGIKADGAITEGNYPTVLSNVCGLPYSPSSIISAICNFMTRLGAANARQLQISGALDIVDCSGCGPWCNREDFTTGAGAFFLISVPPTVGTYVAGVGWETTVNLGLNKLYIGAGPAGARTITNLALFLDMPTVWSGVNHSHVSLYLGGVLQATVNLPDTVVAPGTRVNCAFAAVSCDSYTIYLERAAGAVSKVTAFQDSGNPPAPPLGEPCI